MNKERLEILARRLDRIPQRNFDLNDWVQYEGFFSEGLVCKKGRPACGTVACAVGWAGSIDRFVKEGFYIDKDSALPTYKDLAGYDAVMAFFDLDLEQSLNLFSPVRYSANEQNNPRAVSKRIRELIA